MSQNVPEMLLYLLTTRQLGWAGKKEKSYGKEYSTTPPEWTKHDRETIR